MKHVVVVGAGFAGFTAAKELSKNKEIKVTLVDSKNYHLFQPLLYQIASAGLNPADISMPLRAYFNNKKNVDVFLGKACDFNFDQKTLKVEDLELSYDYLVVAMGAESNYFGNTSWSDHTYELKSVEDALSIRNKLLNLFEEKERKKESKLSIAVIGGGPTGVELAGSIGEFLNLTAKDEFHYFKPKESEICLLEGGPQILSQFSKKLSSKAEGCLKKLGIKVLKNTMVEDIKENTVVYDDKDHPFEIIIWTAGVKPLSIPGEKTVPSPKSPTVVNPDLSLPDHKDVFVLGDQVRVKDQDVPWLAPAAIQQGRCAADNILRSIHGKKRKTFKYKDKGSLAVIGRRFAVANIFGIEFSGFLAWLVWCFAHVIPLVGFRNKFLVFFEFVWSYLNYRKGVRIITRQQHPKHSARA